MESYKQTIGNRISALRAKRGLTQKELAAKVTVSRELVNFWENDMRQIKGDDIARLADALETTCDYLLRGVSAENVDISKETGLTDDSINHLKRLAHIRWGHDNLTLSNAINSFMGSEGFVTFMMGFWDYQIEVEELAKRERYFMQKLKEYEGQLPSGMTLLEYAARLSLESESCLQSESRSAIEQADNVNYKLFKLEQALKRITDSYQKEAESNGQH